MTRRRSIENIKKREYKKEVSVVCLNLKVTESNHCVLPTLKDVDHWCYFKSLPIIRTIRVCFFILQGDVRGFMFEWRSIPLTILLTVFYKEKKGDKQMVGRQTQIDTDINADINTDTVTDTDTDILWDCQALY